MPLIKASEAYPSGEDWNAATVRAFVTDQNSLFIDTIQELRDNDLEQARWAFVKETAGFYRLSLSSTASDDGDTVLRDNIGRRYLKVNESAVSEWADVHVADLTARDAYDDEAEGFVILVSDIGDGRAAFYTMGDGGSGDWIGPAYLTAAGGGGGGGGGSGTVTSVALTVPTGFARSGSPITGSGTIAISYDTGYQGYTSAEASKLSGIASGATANDTDANLKNRANHTGSQLAATISDFSTAADARVSAAIGSTVQAYSANLTTWAGIAPSANAQSLVGAANYAAMRALLDLEAGTDFYSISAANAAFQPLDADLTALAAANNSSVLAATTASFLTADETKLDGIEALADVTDAGNVGSSIHGASAKTTPVDADTMPLIDSAASNVLKKVTWANIKATLKTYFDTLYQPVNAALTSISGLSPSNDDILQRKSGAWANRTLAQLMTDLAALGTTFQPLASALTSWAGVTRASGFDTFAGTPSSANLRGLLTDETGTGSAVFATSPTITTPVIIDATRSNLFTKTEQINDAYWTKTNLTVTANDTTAPDGAATADKVLETSATGAHNISRALTKTAARKRYVMSGYFKGGLTRYLVGFGAFGTGFAAGCGLVFDVAAGVARQVGAFDYGSDANRFAIEKAWVEEAANGFFRLCMLFSTDDTADLNITYELRSDINTASYAGNTSYGCYVWGLQIVEGPTAGVYQVVA